MKTDFAPPSEIMASELAACRSTASSDREKLPWFVLAVLGFSFWFLLAVPFASHRESYSWLAAVRTHSFGHAFSYPLSTTYRPLGDPMTWLGFTILSSGGFPTSAVRQTILQGFIYALFLFAWWLVIAASSERRLLALIACVTGGVFFSGYVHLFHIYGIMYVPGILTTAALLRLHSSDVLLRYEVPAAGVATVLSLWHPFAPALFLGFYVGFYIETFGQRRRKQHIQALAILFVTMIAIAAVMYTVPAFKRIPFDTKLFGFLVSYKTSEINRFASLVAFVLAELAVLSSGWRPRVRSLAATTVGVIAIAFVATGLPVLLLWIGAVLIKLARLRSWSLLFLTLTAAALPFGAGIGTPIYALFALVVAAYATALGWSEGETVLQFINSRYIVVIAVIVLAVLVLMRAGVEIPGLTRAARPLLVERERTFQLENTLAWLHSSAYCGYDLAFSSNSGNPIEDVQGAITRRNRPPASIEDVRELWTSVLQCRNSVTRTPGSVVVTFGEPAPSHWMPVYMVKGKYAGNVTAWIAASQ